MTMTEHVDAEVIRRGVALAEKAAELRAIRIRRSRALNRITDPFATVESFDPFDQVPTAVGFYPDCENPW